MAHHHQLPGQQGPRVIVGANAGSGTGNPCAKRGISSKCSSFVGAPTSLQCDRYVNVWDVRSNGLRVAVSLVITVLNTSLKVVLEWLLLLEKHWTRSEQVRFQGVVTVASRPLQAFTLPS